VNHVIVTGCDANLVMFVEELRRPSCRGDTYHPIVIVSDEQPSKWKYLSARFNDVYYLTGKLIKMEVFERLNMDEAWSLVLLASRDGVVKVDEEHVNSTTLFAYLKLEAHVPHNIFFTVELNSAANMSVLNATMMRRARLAIINTQNSILQNLNKKRIESSNQATAPIFINLRTSNKRGLSQQATPFSAPENSFNYSTNLHDSSQHNSPKNSNFPSLSNLNSSFPPLRSLMNENNDSSNSLNDVSSTVGSTTKEPSRRGSVLFDGNGRFTTKRAIVNKPVIVAGTNNRLANSQLSNFPEISAPSTSEKLGFKKNLSILDKFGGQLNRMKSSSNQGTENSNFVEKLASAINKNEILKSLKADEDLWDAMDSHHVMIIYNCFI
jgi:hypothetical protein